MSWNNLLLRLTLERTGRVEGECAIVGYVKDIEVEKLSFDISTPEGDLERRQDEVDESESAADRFKAARRLLAMRRGSVARASFGPLKVNKRFDKSSTGLLKALSSQEEITEAVFVALRRSELGVKMKSMPWLRVILRKATVKSVDLKLESQGNERLLSEEIVLDYDEIAVEYMPERSPGTMRFSYSRSAF
ncbi:MAG: type VI secretion system tube protein Hcp [Betaproteobacteria bacterium]